MKKVIVMMLLAFAWITVSNSDAAAQKAPKKTTAKKSSKKTTAKAATETRDAASDAYSRTKGGGKLGDVDLGSTEIKYKVPGPRVKFTVSRLALDVKMDNSKLEGITELVNDQPKKVLFLNKATEQPIRISPQEVVNRSRQ